MTNQKQNETIPALPKPAKTHKPIPQNKSKDKHIRTHSLIIYFFTLLYKQRRSCGARGDEEGWDIYREIAW